MTELDTTSEAVLPSLSGSGAKVLLALTIQRNGGPRDAPIHVSLRRLTECTGMVLGSVTRGRRELLELGVMAQDGPETFRLLRPSAPWLPPVNSAVRAIPTSGTASTPEILALTIVGLRLMGMTTTSISSRYAVLVRKKIKNRFQEGFTTKELLAVLDWAKRRRASGDAFAALTNLLYLWGQTFPAHLAAAAADQQSPNTMTFRRGMSRAEFDEDARAAVSRPLPTLQTG